MTKRPRVFVVEDHPVFRRGIEALIGDGYELAGSADSVGPAVDMIMERSPDLVLLDVNLKGGGGALVAEGIRAEGSLARILVLSVVTSRADVVRMFKAGIDGYITKSSGEEHLLEAIRQTLEGGRPVSREIAGYLLDIDEDIPAATGIERLTSREREVTTLIARGYTYRETAAALDPPISVKTLENHMAHIFGKLGLASRHELSSLAYETGFLDPDRGRSEP